jgi:radical SAM protein with 4Fe4S-binding SPASM domain
MLRGWEGASYGLVNTKSGNIRLITEFAFDTLCLCNGKVDFALPLAGGGRESFIAYLLEQGIIESAEKADAVEPWQNYRRYPNQFIENAHWLITGQCNMKCRHCYVSAPHSRYSGLSHEDTMNIAAGIIEAGILSVEFSGGEPLIRDDFFELVELFSRSHTAIHCIYTNGLLVNQELLDRLARYGQRPAFQISFDGPHWHDWMRGVRGAADIALGAMELLVENNFYVHVSSTLHKKSIGELEQTMNVLAEKGISSWKTALVSAEGEWKNESPDMDLSYDELYAAYLEFIPRYFKAGSPVTVELSNFFRCEKGIREYTVPLKRREGGGDILDAPVCPAARKGIQILPNGKLIFCTSTSEYEEEGGATNILQTPLTDALHDSPWLHRVNTRIKTLLEKNKVCGGCEYRLVCGGGCRARAVQKNEGFFGTDSGACTFFKGKWEEKLKAALGCF